MLTIIISTIIGFIIVFCTIGKMDNDFAWKMICVFISFLFSIIGLTIALVLPINTAKISYYKELQTLKDNTTINGTFFIGSGSINQTMTYTYYVKEGDYYQLKQVPASKAKIKYTDKDYKLEIIEHVKVNDLLGKFSIQTKPKKTYVFHIPEGAIRHTFKLDAE